MDKETLGGGWPGDLDRSAGACSRIVGLIAAGA